jgi:tRNA threonylcarbamoyladenosine biosynthesis protein TsaB
LASIEEHQSNSHAALLTVLIEKMMMQSKVQMDDLDAIAVSSGPGSYTGLRIGVSVAKGICFAIQKPLIAITSLKILAAGVLLAEKEVSLKPDALICPMIDARRMEVYTTLFYTDLTQMTDIVAEIIDSASYAEILEKSQILFAGNGSEKCQTFIVHPNAVFIPNFYPLASNMVVLANEAYSNCKFEDVAYFEPFYLKDFIATLPKRKVI